jgi:hypothetical protein
VSTIDVERYHWVNTMLGMLDGAFHLTEEEQAPTLQILRGLMDALDIPNRKVPESVPAGVALEADASIYTEVLAGTRAAGVNRPIRAAVDSDPFVPLETWVQALVAMLTSAYPDLNPVERVKAMTVFTELLVAIGVPDRAVYCYPDEVVRAYQDTLG